MEPVSVALTGRPVRFTGEGGAPVSPDPGVIGLDISSTSVDDVAHTVVQLLLDDDATGFDPGLLDRPVVAELIDGVDIVAREPFDHDQFRRRLKAERSVGESTTRGVLLLTGGDLPPRWVRLAFLAVDITRTAGLALVVRPTTRAELVEGVESAHARGDITDDEQRAVLASIEQRHPTG